MQACCHSLSPVLSHCLSRRWLPIWAIVATGSGGCGSAAQPVLQAPSEHAPSRAERSAAETPTRLPALSESEQLLAARLRLHTAKLTELGERTASKEWNLAAATDYIALTLEASGYVLNRQGFTSEGRVAQNLEVRLPGSRLGHQWILLGARFDSPPGSAGADDNASGAAALLALSEVMVSTRAQRSVKFVFFSDASDRTDSNLSGAHHYAAGLAKASLPATALPKTSLPEDPSQSGLTSPNAPPPEEPNFAGTPRHETLLMLEFGGLGVFSLAPGSQKYPDYAVSHTPSIGEFIALAGYVGEEDSPLGMLAIEFAKVANLPVKRWVL
ncbi:MAG: hypothetical protein RJA70_4586, partial [Pseudomonadota bacterium]